MNYYNKIKNIILDVEIQGKIKDYSKNEYALRKYYEIGKLLIDAQGGEKRAKYGDSLIKDYSLRLSFELGKKYNTRTLRRMRQFYIFFKNEKWSPMATKLSWSHYVELLSLNDINEINYYINKCINNNISRNKLRELVKSKEYERLPKASKDNIILNKDNQINEMLPNPIIINNKNNIDIIKEKTLQQLILEDISSFLRQLGNGFTFIDNEYPIKSGNYYNYIDLLLFNYEYNSFIVVELKVTELKKEHIGQIQIYMSYIDKNLKKEYHNRTVGIIICKKDNQFVMEYCSNPNIVFTKYIII